MGPGQDGIWTLYGGGAIREEEVRGGRNELAGSWDSQETLSPLTGARKAADIVCGSKHHTQAEQVLNTCQVDEPGALLDPGRG